jgi:hypothetical protein
MNAVSVESQVPGMRKFSNRKESVRVSLLVRRRVAPRSAVIDSRRLSAGPVKLNCRVRVLVTSPLKNTSKGDSASEEL